MADMLHAKLVLEGCPFPLDAFERTCCVEQLKKIAHHYELMTQQWEIDEQAELWGDEYADQKAEDCWQIAVAAQVELVRLRR